MQVDDSEAVNFLLQTEIIPLCLRIMETGSELSKTVATFIVQKILLDDTGLNYICSTAERFYAVWLLLHLFSNETCALTFLSCADFVRFIRNGHQISGNPIC